MHRATESTFDKLAKVRYEQLISIEPSSSSAISALADSRSLSTLESALRAISFYTPQIR